MNETVITARSNPWVQQWLRYQAKPALRKAAAVVWLEGEHLVQEALSRASSFSKAFAIDTLVFSNDEAGRRLHQTFCDNHAIARAVNVVCLGESAYKALCSMDSVPSVCAVLKLSDTPTRIDYSRPAVVLDRVQDPGNIGTIIRLCAAFGVPQVLLSAGCASAWSSKALRAAQGAQLALSVFEDVDLTAACTGFQQAGTPIYATSLAAGSVPLSQIQLPEKMMLAFGHEGQGISSVIQAFASKLVHIPMQGGFESLNVGTAAAICLWQWQNSQRS